MEQSWQVMDQKHSCIHGIGVSKLTSESFEVICTYLSIYSAVMTIEKSRAKVGSVVVPEA
jgi:hypothetical protein